MVNRLLGLSFALFGLLLLFVVIPRHTEIINYGWMRPHTFPNLIATVIAVSGLVLALRPRGRVEFQCLRAARAFLYLGIASAGVYLVGLFGFEVVATPFALVMMLLIGERRPLWLLVGAVGIPVTVWVSVHVLLGRPLP